MAGEREDYKRNEDEIRRDQAREYGFWYRPKISLWKTVLKAAYWLSTPALVLAAIRWFAASGGVWAGLVILGGFLLVFVVIPILCWLVQKHTDV